MKQYRIDWRLALAAAALFTVGSAVASPQRAQLEAVDHLFAQEYAAQPLGSLTVGVVSGKDLVWTRSYGFADEKNHTPATRDTVYRIGSITKQFTATMLLQLVERGKVRLSDPVVKYYPDLKKVQGWPPAQPITLLDIATHRSGLAREPDGCQGGGLRDCQYIIGPVATWEQTLESALPHVRLEAPPESHFQYSNVGYAILGAALANAAEVPYTRYITRNIFEPLGMTHSGFEPDAAMRKHLSKGYISIPTGYNSQLPAAELVRGRGYKVPNGAIFTTVGDLAKFVSFEMGEGPQDVLKHSVQRANYQRSFPQGSSLGLDHARDVSYGVGFEKMVVNGHVLIGHDGDVAGFSALALFDPDRRIGIVCLRNSNNGAYRKAAIKALVSILGQ